MIPGAKLSYDLEINDRNGKTKALGFFSRGKNHPKKAVWLRYQLPSSAS